MPVAKLVGPDAMKAEEGTDNSLDTLIRQAVGKEPLFSYSRTGDSPVQWIQLLHALDQPDLPGWPLLAPIKIQMQKCEKCAREFCSPINYRRHVRVHRRSMNFHKEPQKYRDLLGAFWDKLSYHESKEIMSFKDVNLEEVAGSSIVRNIAVNIRKPIFLSLPQVYVKAGSALVDIIQGRHSILPVSSEELFSLLDDASEKTFLCAGTPDSLQKYVFDGEIGKTALEMKNLIACTSFLVEQVLIKAWLADKDAEALRCQKLLVEEEEAAQRRRAELLERRRQRKIRQKEQRAKDQTNNTTSDSTIEETSGSEVNPLNHPIQMSTTNEGLEVVVVDEVINNNNNNNNNIEEEGGCSSDDHSDSAATTEQQQQQQNKIYGNNHFTSRWQVARSRSGGGGGGFHGNQMKWEQKQHREQKVVLNGTKVWTKKPNKSEHVKLFKVVKKDENNQKTSQSDSCQLMIGSISVTLRKSSNGKSNGSSELRENVDPEIKTNGSRVMFSGARKDYGRGNDGQTVDQSVCNVQVEENGAIPFSVDAAKAFLAQRWKEATSREHVTLVLKNDNEGAGPTSVGGKVNAKSKFRSKPKYIQKQRRTQIYN